MRTRLSGSELHHNKETDAGDNREIDSQDFFGKSWDKIRWSRDCQHERKIFGLFYLLSCKHHDCDFLGLLNAAKAFAMSSGLESLEMGEGDPDGIGHIEFHFSTGISCLLI